MIFNTEIKSIYWVLEKKAVVEEYRNQLRYTSITEVAPTEDEIVYFGSNILRHPFLENGKLREATDKELLDKGLYTLSENEVLVGDFIKMIYEFPIPEEMAKPVFNKEVLKWEETATQPEIDEHRFKQSVAFYNSELEFASKATAELACEIISPEMYNDVKSYMKAIDPYAQPNVAVFALKINRPSIFDRYN